MPFQGEEEFGKDLRIEQKADMLGLKVKFDLEATPTKNIALSVFRHNLAQALLNKLRTWKGELPAHPEYGSDLNEVLGMPQSNTTKSLVELIVIEAITEDPRVESVSRIEVSFDRTQKTCTIDVDVIPITSTNPINLCWDFFWTTEV